MLKTVSSEKVDKLLCFFFIIPFIEIESFSRITGLQWEYLVLADCLVLLMVYVRNLKLNKLQISILLLYAIILISTIKNHRDTFPAVYYGIRMFSFVILIDYYSAQHLLFYLLSSIKKILGIIIVINLLFQILAQNYFGVTHAGNYSNFFVSDNFLGYYYVAFLLTVFITNYTRPGKKGKINFLIWFAICLFSLIKAWAATGLILLIIYILMIAIRKINIIQKLSPIKSLSLNVGITVLVVFFQIQRLFEWLIVGILQKDLTLSHRTLVWQAAIKNIIQEPLLGHGTVKGGRLAVNAVKVDGIIFTGFSHNIFLEVLMQGGILALICYFGIYYFADKAIRSHKDEREIRSIICISVFVILFMQFSEFAFYIPIASMPIFLCFYYKGLINEINNMEVQS